MPALDAIRQQIRANYLPDEDEAVKRLAEATGLSAEDRKSISARAADLVRAVRGSSDPRLMEVFLSAYGLSTKEGVALMCLAEALLRTPDDQILALDGKVTLDANADFRHPEHAEFEDRDATDPLELKAKENDLNYVKLDGQVGIIGNGAGLVMSTLDVVAYAGEKHGGVKPANFLDIGGGASAEVMANGLDVILGDSQVKSVFVNVFGGITACDAVANGIVKALEILGEEADKPLVVRLDGNRVEEGRKILADANHPLVVLAQTMDEGADKAAELAAK